MLKQLINHGSSVLLRHHFCLQIDAYFVRPPGRHNRYHCLPVVRVSLSRFAYGTACFHLAHCLSYDWMHDGWNMAEGYRKKIQAIWALNIGKY